MNLLEKQLSTVYFKDVRFPWVTLYYTSFLTYFACCRILRYFHFIFFPQNKGTYFDIHLHALPNMPLVGGKPLYSLSRGLGRLLNESGHFRKEKNLFSLLGSQPWNIQTIA